MSRYDGSTGEDRGEINWGENPVYSSVLLFRVSLVESPMQSPLAIPASNSCALRLYALYIRYKMFTRLPPFACSVLSNLLLLCMWLLATSAKKMNTHALSATLQSRPRPLGRWTLVGLLRLCPRFGLLRFCVSHTHSISQQKVLSCLEMMMMMTMMR